MSRNRYKRKARLTHPEIQECFDGYISYWEDLSAKAKDMRDKEMCLYFVHILTSLKSELYGH